MGKEQYETVYKLRKDFETKVGVDDKQVIEK